jgi:hypothetical protein
MLGRMPGGGAKALATKADRFWSASSPAYLTIGRNVSADVLMLTVLSAAALALAMNLGAGLSGASGNHGWRGCNPHAPQSIAQASGGVALEMKAPPSTAKVRASPIVIARLGNNRWAICLFVRDYWRAGNIAMRQRRDDSSPLTLDQAAAGSVRLIVWCKRCSHQIEPDPAELVARHGEAPTVIEWAARLVCSKCGARDADFVVTGPRR